MRLALVGPSQSGKSTLFAAITGTRPDPTHPTAEHLATVHVPDARLDYLAELYKPKKYTTANLEFLDTPGAELSDASGVAAFRKAMEQARKCDGLVIVVRAFASDDVMPYRGRIDPRADLDELHTEFVFADLEQVMNRVGKLEKSVLKPSKTREQELRELSLMKRVQEALENESPVSSVIQSADDRHFVQSFGFLTLKPVIAVVNVGESDVAKPPAFEYPHARATIAMAAEIEWEIAQLEEADRATFLADLGLSAPARTRLIRTCYDALGLLSFLTCGEDEVRAWTIYKGMEALEAAGKIHSDIMRGFIKAETVAFDDLKANKDMRGAKSANKVRLEPKHYVVQDGDIINFRFNV